MCNPPSITEEKACALWSVLEFDGADISGITNIVNIGSARLESLSASLTLTSPSSRHPALDDNPPTPCPRGLPALLSRHICNKALITSVEVSSGIQDMIIRSGALRDCNRLILSEHRAA